MSDDNNVRWCIEKYKQFNGKWSIGIGLTHDDFDTYLFINLFKWAFAIGRMTRY